MLRMGTFMHTEGFFQDPTWKCVPTMMYTIAEAGTYLIASCMPSLRPLKRHYFGDHSFARAVGYVSQKSKHLRSSKSETRRASKTDVQLRVIDKGSMWTPEDNKKWTLHAEHDGFVRLNDKGNSV